MKHAAETRIRPARAEDALALGALAMRSKAYWGYSAEFMEQCRAELSYDVTMLASPRFSFRVAEMTNGTLAGFHAIEWQDNDVCELEALFVEPDCIGRGVGRQLMDDACGLAVERGVETLRIQGDPHARAFYEASGCVQVGERASASVAGRSLPLFELRLRNRNTAEHGKR